jgi:hypothetical protein
MRVRQSGTGEEEPCMKTSAKKTAAVCAAKPALQAGCAAWQG